MSDENASQTLSTLTTATTSSQITGKRKRVESADEVVDPRDAQDGGDTPGKGSENLQEFLLDIIEVLRMFVSHFSALAWKIYIALLPLKSKCC